MLICTSSEYTLLFRDEDDTLLFNNVQAEYLSSADQLDPSVDVLYAGNSRNPDRVTVYGCPTHEPGCSSRNVW